MQAVSAQKIGILALQGNFSEHAQRFAELGAEPILIRYSEQLSQIDRLVIPGGESTCIDKLTAAGSGVDTRIFSLMKERIEGGMPVWGTCMGSIFLARNIEGSSQGRLSLMDIEVRRNAFGPQKFSFELPLPIPCLSNQPFLSVFIRAPLFLSTGKEVEVLAKLPTDESFGALAGLAVMARQKNMLATAFHPELVSDTRVHSYFLSI
ncbi:MAG: pyridoxal 5'-phosphate synthase glutaminase subunit PdxT [Candidatus Obscuribacter phosphatis]|uniref:Pyridoxal 5'-phosphate synthase subunit PdxT n=1 Tax=Candidatus Obscuribacter phosphatis TaxID=1906157 RepID=A0A8J7TKE3_9BACT|nr:pyridoxal 5'-phosphate synthase glutaminase subunit PdxT [Candidatus Obscuribacter phosphatis]